MRELSLLRIMALILSACSEFPDFTANHGVKKSCKTMKYIIFFIIIIISACSDSYNIGTNDNHPNINDTIINEDETIKWQSMPVSRVSVIDNKGDSIFHLESGPTFVGMEDAKSIYIGNILTQKRIEGDNIKDKINILYNKVLLGSIFNNQSFVIETEPSFDATNKIFQDIKKCTPIQNITFNFSSKPIVYHSAKELNLISRGNIGINLDSLINGSGYKTIKMKHKTGFIYSVYNELFSIDMDYPNPCLIKNVLSCEDYKDLVYINSITCGKHAYIIIESDFTEKELKSAIMKLACHENLNNNDLEIINKLVKYSVYFDAERKIIVERQNASFINKIEDKIRKIPITYMNFSVLRLSDNTVTNLYYDIKL